MWMGCRVAPRFRRMNPFDDWRSYCQYHMARFSQLAMKSPRRFVLGSIGDSRGPPGESAESVLRRGGLAHALTGGHRLDCVLPDLWGGVQPCSQPLPPCPC